VAQLWVINKGIVSAVGLSEMCSILALLFSVCTSTNRFSAIYLVSVPCIIVLNLQIRWSVLFIYQMTWFLSTCFLLSKEVYMIYECCLCLLHSSFSDGTDRFWWCRLHLEKTFLPGNLRRIHLYGSGGTICKFGCYHSSNHGIQPFMEINIKLESFESSR